MFLTTAFTKVALAINNVVVLTQGTDLNYLKTGGNGAFSKLLQVVQSYFADAYQFLLAVGISIMALAGVLAFIFLGVLKDSTKIKENKNWIMRILGSAAGIALVLTLVTLAFGAGSSVDGTLEDVTPTVIPTPTGTAMNDVETELPYGAVIRI